MHLVPDTIAIYARISKDDARSEGGSVESQIARCHQRLASMGVLEHELARVRVFRDDGYSGKSTDRPAFQELQRAIHEGSVKVLVFSELSRISRDLRGFLDVSDLWRSKDLQWISLREAFDTTSLHGRLIIHILMALAQFEREQTAQRTRANMLSRAQRGIWNGGQTPWGYRTRRDAPGGLEVVEEEAVGVRRTFELYLELGSARLVAQALEAEGIRRRGRPLRGDALEHVLRNPTYIGLREVNAASRGDDPATLSADQRYELVPAKWPPLIDEDTWRRVRLLATAGKGRNHVRPNRGHDFVMTGLVTCRRCGVLLQGASAKSARFVYYRHPSGAGGECPAKAWPAAEVEGAVLRRLERYVRQPSVLRAIVEDANRELAGELPTLVTRLEDARRRVGRLEHELATLAQRLLEIPTGVSAEWLYAVVSQRQSELRDSRSAVGVLEAEVRSLEARRLDPARFAEGFRGLLTAWEHLDPHERRQVLLATFDAVELEPHEAYLTFAGEAPEASAVKSSAPQTEKPSTENRYWAIGGTLRLGRSARTPAVRVGALRDRVRLRAKASVPSPTPRALLTAADAHAAATRWRALMERRGLSQAELAAEVGVTPARVSQLLTLLRVDASRLDGISIKAGLRLVR